MDKQLEMSRIYFQATFILNFFSPNLLKDIKFVEYIKTN